jgi:hypothetical protein
LMSAFDQSGHRQSSWVDSRLHRVLRFNFVAARIPTFDLDQFKIITLNLLLRTDWVPEARCAVRLSN